MQTDHQNSGYLGSGNFYGESPMLSIDLQSRLSPPSSTGFLSAQLPETPTNAGSKSMDTGVSLDPKHKRNAAAAISKMMTAEQQSQRPKREEEDASGLGSQPRLFPPLDPNQSNNGGNAMRQSNASSQQQQQQQPGPMTNMLRTSRLSSNIGDESFFDNFNANDFGAYSFSPGEMVRGLNPIPESPMSQNLRRFQYTSQYNPMMQPTGAWQQMPNQYMHNMPPQGYPQGALGGDLSLPPAHSGKGKTHKRRKDEDSDDDDDGSKPRKKKKASKPVDPNEPKITSKHRGVCWYKRTKKWVVQTKVNGKRVHVGYFDDEEKAAEAYKNAVQGIQNKKALEAKKSMEEANSAISQQHGEGQGEDLRYDQ